MDKGQSNHLSDIIFQRRLSQQLKFEGAFAPLLALIVGLTTPQGLQGTFVVVAAVGLVIIAFLRWLTFTGRFADEELFIEKTVRPVELCAIIGVVQLFHFGADQFQSFIPLDLPVLMTCLVVLGTILYILFVELVFRTYRLGWGSLYYLRYHEAGNATGPLDSAEEVIEAVNAIGELFRLPIVVILGRIWLEVAYYVLKDALPQEERDKYINELAEFVNKVEEMKGTGRNFGIVGTFVVSAIVVLPVFVVVAWGISVIVGMFGAVVLALMTMRLTKHVVGFSYIAFGTLRFDQFITSSTRSIGLLAGYTGIIYLLFFYPL